MYYRWGHFRETATLKDLAVLPRAHPRCNPSVANE